MKEISQKKNCTLPNTIVLYSAIVFLILKGELQKLLLSFIIKQEKYVFNHGYLSKACKKMNFEGRKCNTPRN